MLVFDYKYIFFVMVYVLEGYAMYLMNSGVKESI